MRDWHTYRGTSRWIETKGWHTKQQPWLLHAESKIFRALQETGKTRASLVIILALAALNLPVMIAAGSNKGVDNLAIAVAEALSQHGKPGNLIGSFYRVSTPARQI